MPPLARSAERRISCRFGEAVEVATEAIKHLGRRDFPAGSSSGTDLAIPGLPKGGADGERLIVTTR